MKFEPINKEELKKKNLYSYRTEQLYKLILDIYKNSNDNVFKIIDDEKMFSSVYTLKAGVEKAVRFVKRDLPKILFPDMQIYYGAFDTDKVFKVFSRNKEIYIEINRFTKEQLEEIKIKNEKIAMEKMQTQRKAKVF